MGGSPGWATRPGEIDVTAAADRCAVLKALGATPAECAELLRYNENHFDPHALERGRSWPLADEAFVEVWEGYAREARSAGAWAVLREALVQLRFPVRPGISREPAYRAATRGQASARDGAAALELRRPGDVRIEIHRTPAGRLPVVVAPHRDDFELLVQALAKRNEPAPMPASIGACMVAGYTNVDRLRRLRERWSAGQPFPTEAGWRRELGRLAPRKELYQDRFVVASTTPYSGVPAERLGLTREAWRRSSLAIRVKHESMHYFTRRVFGSMKNRLLDEIIADYAGIAHAAGRFRADWALRFLGLESYPRYRAGGRLEHYRGDPPLSDGAFRILQHLVKRAVDNLERWSAAQDDPPRPDAALGTVLALTRLTVEELAAADAADRLRAAARAAAVHSEASIGGGTMDGP